MTIPLTRYVDITSGIGAGAEVARRDLICRLFTSNTDLPATTFMEFQDLDSVAAIFTTNSNEYRRAQFYFGFVSKNTTRPKLISFARWAKTDVSAYVYSGPITATSLTAIQAVTAGTFSLTFGAGATATQTISALDFSSAASLAAVATALQTRIRAATAGGSAFTGATATYNVSRNRFEITSGQTGAAAVATADGTANAASVLRLLSTTNAQLSAGAAATSITDTLAASAEMSNNFGSFVFVDSLTEAEVTEAATWNNTNNVLFQFHVPVLPADAATYSTNLIGLAGTGISLMSTTAANEYPEMLPTAILAATDYTRRASVQNYMFQTANLTPTVQSNSDANLYDGLRINYYGETQTAGQLRRFYQRGVLTGNPAINPVDMNVFANEQWLKDDAGARIMSLLLSLARVPANQNGRGQILNVLQGTIDQALLNGSITVFRPLTAIQRIFVVEQSGNEEAPFQVENSGYWVDAQIRSTTTSDNRVEFEANYTLIYLKDDVIRKVNGTHTLI